MTTLAICAVFGLLALPASQDLAPRFVTTLPNGARFVVEAMPNASNISVRLLLSSRGLGDDQGALQHRHLLEHLCVKGPDAAFARRAEADGLFLVGQTYRDAVSFEVRCSKEKLAQALEILDGVLREPRMDATAIEGELKVLAEEYAIEDEPARFSAALWSAAYSASGVVRESRVPSVEELRELRGRLVAANRMTLAVAGNIGLAEATKAARSFLAGRMGVDSTQGPSRGMASVGEARVPWGRGAARAAGVGAYSDRESVATLAAALSIASESKDGYVIYTPSVSPGLVIVGDGESPPALAAAIESASGVNLEALYVRGKDLARRWVERFLADPSGVTYLRGLLLSQSSVASPDLMKEAIAATTLADFRLACARFRLGSCVSALGER